jgi:hypothetical protein
VLLRDSESLTERGTSSVPRLAHHNCRKRVSQSHFTIRFPLKSAADAKAVTDLLPPLMPDFFKAEDSLGTIHYSRFTLLSERSLLFLGDFDGEFGELMGALGRAAGPVFEAIWPPPS